MFITNLALQAVALVLEQGYFSGTYCTLEILSAFKKHFRICVQNLSEPLVFTWICLQNFHQKRHVSFKGALVTQLSPVQS